MSTLSPLMGAFLSSGNFSSLKIAEKVELFDVSVIDALRFEKKLSAIVRDSCVSTQAFVPASPLDQSSEMSGVSVD